MSMSNADPRESDAGRSHQQRDTLFNEDVAFLPGDQLMLRRVSRFLIRLLLAYAGGWTIAYFLILRDGGGYFFQYLRLAWTSTGEIPLLVNLVALAIAFTSVVLAEVWLRARRRREPSRVTRAAIR